MLTADQVEQYARDGALVVPDVLDAAEIAALRTATDSFVASARGVTSHTEILDLEDSHTAQRPLVRRIKNPERHHPAYRALLRHPRILAVLQALLGPDIRFDAAKLNMKAAGYGAAVEWHQDWAFYPHTNDDLAAVGVMMDDMALENGPLLVLRGTHTGPLHDHHARGRFCGAIDTERSGIDFTAAVPLLGSAGSITVHHARLIHGSAPNNSARDRRLLLLQFRAADAWPLLGVPSWDEYEAQMVSGSSSLTPRLADVPVRLPLPPAGSGGSIYENQRGLERRFFEPAAMADAPA